MTSNRVFLLGLFVFAAITVVIALLVGPDWMDWGGWRWVSMPWAVWVGIWFGWNIKATKARSKRFRDALIFRRPVTNQEWSQAYIRMFELLNGDEASEVNEAPSQRGAMVTQIIIRNRLIEFDNAAERPPF